MTARETLARALYEANYPAGRSEKHWLEMKHVYELEAKQGLAGLSAAGYEVVPAEVVKAARKVVAEYRHYDNTILELQRNRQPIGSQHRDRFESWLDDLDDKLLLAASQEQEP